MGHRTLVASGETGSTVSAGSIATFPPSGDLWNDRDVTHLRDVKVLASLSASANYSMRLMASFEDPSSGSVFDGIVEQFVPGDSLGDGAGREAFRSAGKHMHFSRLEIENGSAADMTVEQLGAVWRSA